MISQKRCAKAVGGRKRDLELTVSQLQELVSIIAATLQARLAKEDAYLLRDDVEKFKVCVYHDADLTASF